MKLNSAFGRFLRPMLGDLGGSAITNVNQGQVRTSMTVHACRKWRRRHSKFIS